MIGGVCAGIAESASIDTLLVRVTAIALCFVTFGLAIVLYLVLFAILPIKPSSGSFIDLEPSRVQSERYRRVVNLSKDHVLSGKPEVRVYEQKAPTPAVLHSEELSTPSYRLPLVFFGLAFLITTVVIVVATLAEEGRSFVSFFRFISSQQACSSWCLRALVVRFLYVSAYSCFSVRLAA